MTNEDLFERLKILTADQIETLVQALGIDLHIPREGESNLRRINAIMDIQKRSTAGVDALARLLADVTGTRPVADKDRALILDLHFTSMPLPPILNIDDGFTPERTIRIPAQHDSKLVDALRDPKGNHDVWTRVAELIEEGVKSALSGLEGTLHVFAQAPHGAGFILGRTLDALSRSASIQLHQWDPNNKRFNPWPLNAALFEKPSYLKLEIINYREGRGSLVSIEMPRPVASVEVIDDIVYSVRAHYALRLHQLNEGWLHNFAAAKQALGEILSTLGKMPEKVPITIATSLPIAMVVALGSALAPTVYPRVNLTHYDQNSKGYVIVAKLEGYKTIVK